MNRTYLLSAVVVVALVSVVVAIFASDSEKQTVRQQNAKPAEAQQIEKASQASTITPKTTTKVKAAQRQAASKATAKTKTKKKTTNKSDKASTEKVSETRVKRVRWPGMKYRMVRVREEQKIEPVTELRSWTRQQWVNKVTELRKAEKDEQANKYIAAYNKQYPKKDLNNYLK